MSGRWTRWAAGAMAAAVAAATGGCEAAPAKPRPQMHAFRTDGDLAAFLKRRIERPEALPMAVAPAPAAADAAQELVVTAQKAEPGITNTQEQGVDEGDIVKRVGDLLVILRRGRIFTVSTAGGGLQPVDWIAAYPPKAEGDGWYDEMLVSGRTIVVIGYSYAHEGTQVSRFSLDARGRLAFRDAYQLRSDDYYSSRNYASRLIGSKLIFYTPLRLGWSRNPLDSMPAIRRWGPQAPVGPFRRIAPPSRVFVPEPLFRSNRLPIEMLHTVTSCDLAAPVMNCEATGVLGPASRNFYVSPRAVYVWANAWDDAPQPAARRLRPPPAEGLLFRLPLGPSAPAAVAVRGAPVDQFSFREDAADGVLNVLVRSEGRGDAMWRTSFSEGAAALLRLPIARFGDGAAEAPAGDYRTLPRLFAQDERADFQNRFVGDYVLYGAGRSWVENAPTSGVLVAAPVRGGPAQRLELNQTVDRIEVMGPSALVVGTRDDDLSFKAIELAGAPGPRVGDGYVLPAASEGETRSHAFFYRPDAASPDGREGVLGLPVSRPGRPAYRQLFDNSAAMLFLRRRPGAFAPLGELGAAAEGFVPDDCVASCVDWYGNARPIFMSGRVFALLGYELVEGRIGPDGIRETARVNFAPRPRAQARRK